MKQETYTGTLQQLSPHTKNTIDSSGCVNAIAVIRLLLMESILEPDTQQAVGAVRIFVTGEPTHQNMRLGAI